MSHILMGEGDLIDLRDPKNVNLERCVHTLARICRYGGNIPRCSKVLYYSVAQHSVLVSRLLQVWGFDEPLQAAGLLHDVHEALMGDVPTPVKRWLGEVVSPREDALQRKVLPQVWEGPLQVHSSAVKFADMAALVIEVEALGFDRATFFRVGPPPIPYDIPSVRDVRKAWGLLEPNEFKTLREVIEADTEGFLRLHAELRAQVPVLAPRKVARREQFDLFTDPSTKKAAACQQAAGPRA